MNEINDIEIGRQLRRPDGELGIEIGEKMNSSNNTMYDLVFSRLVLKSNFKVLEIGYGNGKFIGDLFKINPDITVFGVDFSDTMYSQACLINKDLIADNKVVLKSEDACAMSFPDSSFDVIFTNNTLYFWKFDEQVKEIKRVLKPGGKLYIGYRPKEVMINLPFVEEHFTLYNPDDLERLLSQHGFKILENKSQTIKRVSIDGSEVTSIDNCLVGERAA